jgi:transcriptional regulator with XRE-family HTH domain
MEPIGSRIRDARKRYGMSQAELARRIDISKTAMNDLERGRTTNPGVLYVVAIADIFHMSVDTLLGREVSHADA